MPITEDPLEQQCLGWFQEGGWETFFGPDIAHDGAAPERANYREVVLVGRLTRSLAWLKHSNKLPFNFESAVKFSLN